MQTSVAKVNLISACIDSDYTVVVTYEVVNVSPHDWSQTLHSPFPLKSIFAPDYFQRAEIGQLVLDISHFVAETFSLPISNYFLGSVDGAICIIIILQGCLGDKINLLRSTA